MQTALAGSAVFALVLGTSVYLLDRDWTSTLMLAPLAVWQPQPLLLFGRLGGSLPSFCHAYAFALLSILLLRPVAAGRAAGALCWLVIASLLEVLQAVPVSDWLSALAATPAGGPVLGALAAYAAHGRFDPADLLAAGLGCLTAYSVALVAEERS